MSTGNVHLIVTCTRRKTITAGQTVFPYEHDAGNAYEVWLERLARARNDGAAITAGELYTGQHWGRAAAAAKRTGAELWVISAGLGLLHVSDPVVPYEATFSSMPFSHSRLWESLTACPPAERRYASLRTLMQARPDDRFVVAALRCTCVPLKQTCSRGGTRYVRLNSCRLSPPKATRAA